MKGLLVLLAVLAAVWLWRSRASAISQRPSSSTNQAAPPLDTVACRHCHVHIPRAEAVQGQRGSYCGLEHLHQAEP
ncbi:PP0621 family protein [Rhodoferax sp.]|uniref:PP0621 family protein n=1 Tax=Rhodoferax sp. TaxID=50421 RepID=UPI0025EE48CF|nr:PP0621 family protein [Rhodoferax sp.]MCM2297357.1 hypothetical protein [Rhodoferax sp.]